jgi:hypothetical protein
LIFAQPPTAGIAMPSSNPFTNSSLIQIRLTRDNDADNDDRIVIKYKDEDMYKIYFKDGNLTSSSAYCTVLTGDELDIYIESLFTLLVRDTDPFKSIEFMLPCFPCLRYEIQDLRQGKLRSTLKRIMPILYAAAKI